MVCQNSKPATASGFNKFQIIGCVLFYCDSRALVLNRKSEIYIFDAVGVYLAADEFEMAIKAIYQNRKSIFGQFKR